MSLDKSVPGTAEAPWGARRMPEHSGMSQILGRTEQASNVIQMSSLKIGHGVSMRLWLCLCEAGFQIRHLMKTKKCFKENQFGINTARLCSTPQPHIPYQEMAFQAERKMLFIFIFIYGYCLFKYKHVLDVICKSHWTGTLGWLWI